ncbi:unnamed protein product [Trifolium pratense]|uniref:Uncharacterized protein n=1 Tax=Trifolium pratense TaxID=57577 RepID=A0ACB0LFM2_TRIPR|nr:unnamed protein product [Trifolium pratense]
MARIGLEFCLLIQWLRWSKITLVIRLFGGLFNLEKKLKNSSSLPLKTVPLFSPTHLTIDFPFLIHSSLDLSLWIKDLARKSLLIRKHVTVE